MKVTIHFQSDEDAHFFMKWVDLAKKSEGTAGGLYSGLACSAIKRAKVKATKKPTPEPDTYPA